jgi:hypothetical protein
MRFAPLLERFCPTYTPLQASLSCAAPIQRPMRKTTTRSHGVVASAWLPITLSNWHRRERQLEWFADAYCAADRTAAEWYQSRFHIERPPSVNVHSESSLNQKRLLEFNLQQKTVLEMEMRRKGWPEIDAVAFVKGDDYLLHVIAAMKQTPEQIHAAVLRVVSDPNSTLATIAVPSLDMTTVSEDEFQSAARYYSHELKQSNLQALFSRPVADVWYDGQILSIFASYPAVSYRFVQQSLPKMSALRAETGEYKARLVAEKKRVLARIPVEHADSKELTRGLDRAFEMLDTFLGQTTRDDSLDSLALKVSEWKRRMAASKESKSMTCWIRDVEKLIHWVSGSNGRSKERYLVEQYHQNLLRPVPLRVYIDVYRREARKSRYSTVPDILTRFRRGRILWEAMPIQDESIAIERAHQIAENESILRHHEAVHRVEAALRQLRVPIPLFDVSDEERIMRWLRLSELKFEDDFGATSTLCLEFARIVFHTGDLRVYQPQAIAFVRALIEHEKERVQLYRRTTTAEWPLRVVKPDEFKLTEPVDRRLCRLNDRLLPRVDFRHPLLLRCLLPPDVMIYVLDILVDRGILVCDKGVSRQPLSVRCDELCWSLNHVTLCDIVSELVREYESSPNQLIPPECSELKKLSVRAKTVAVRFFATSTFVEQRRRLVDDAQMATLLLAKKAHEHSSQAVMRALPSHHLANLSKHLL